MTNYEHYKEQIKRFTRMGQKVAINKDTNEITHCLELRCNKCLFGGTDSCSKKSQAWADDEYIEEVDWSKIPVDTPILVSDDNKCWYRSYFAKYDNYAHRVCTWRSGRTSWSINYDGSYLLNNKDIWKYAKLAEVNDEIHKDE